MTTQALIDTSVLYSIFNKKDVRRTEITQYALENTVSILVPPVVLPEVSFLFVRDFGHHSVVTFMKEFPAANLPLVGLDVVDVARAGEIMNQYATAEFDLVDCCIMAMAERLNITTILTFDRRDFSIFRPAHCDYFDLAP